jgi:apolipoprotein N-acyltransferase
MAGMVDEVVTQSRAELRLDAFARSLDAVAKTFAKRSWWTVPVAIGAGLVLLLGFPPYGFWIAIPFGVAMLAVATYRRGFWAGAGLGLLTGLSLFIPLLSWAGGYVGPVWLFLPVGESFYIALLGGLSALVTPLLQRGFRTPQRRQPWWTLGWSLVIGALWVLQEALRDRTPFGGFPWGRLAFAQVDSPFIRFAAVGGAPLVTFAAAAFGGLLATLPVMLIYGDGRRLVVSPPKPVNRDLGLRNLLRAAPILLAFVLLVGVLPWAAARLGTADAGSVRVAVVQGNVPRLGLNFNAQRRAVLDNHVNATLALAERVRSGQEPQPALVVWPENASDIDPILNVDATNRIQQAARAIGVPILVGGLLDGPGPKDIRNVGIVWDPVTGPGKTYVKRHPVPFAEYMPIRSFARMITDKVDLVRTDFVAGPEPGVLDVGPVTVGDVICFEVAYDNVVRDTVSGNAQLLVVQTNNATFNEAEALQQLAMVRLRAVEHGRPALMASTVGVSAFVDEAGNVYDATQFNAEAVIAREVVLRSGRTMATRLGILPELALGGLAVAAVVVAVVLARRRERERMGAGE